MANVALAFVCAIFLAALAGGPAIGMLSRFGARQTISEDAPQSHTGKQGTPTMGGLVILAVLAAIVTASFLLSRLGAHRMPERDYTVLALLALTLGFGAIGFVDDYLSARRTRNLGLRAREKVLAQCIVATLFVLWLANTAQAGLTTSVALSPYLVVGQTPIYPAVIDLRVWYYPLAALLVVGLSNATNITDGVDGLTGGLGAAAGLALAALTNLSVQPGVTVFAVTLAGALLGFLWWNCHPARMFMGDTGSLAIGAALAGVALVSKQEVAGIVVCLVFWLELLTVVLQVTVFKWRKLRYGVDVARRRRVFLRAPLHHHLEERGWHETTVVTRMWIAGATVAAIALLWCRT